MSVIELEPKLLPVDLLGIELSFTRDELGKYLQSPYISNEGYTSLMTGYLNAFCGYHFRNCIPPFAKYLDGAIILKNEVQHTTGHTIESVYDIEPRLKDYCRDENANELRSLGFSALPRAMSMTLIDLMDQYRTVSRI